MGMSVSGLGSSGIDVSSLVNQLMAVERAPQDRLNTQKNASLTRQTTWGSVSTQLAGLQGALDAVGTPSALNSSTVTSSNTSVLSATATGDASVSSVALQVKSLAAAEQRASAGYASTSSLVGAGTLVVAGGSAAAGFTAVTASGIADGRHTLTVKTGADAGGTAKLTLDGTDYDIAVGNGPVTVGGLTLDGSSLRTGASVDLTVATTTSDTTMVGLAGLIASYGGPAAAAAIDLGTGTGTGTGTDQARLVLSANKSGTTNGLTVSGTGDLAALGSGMTVNRPASDAVVQMGNLTVTRSTNTIADMIPGVSLNLLSAAPGQDVTLSVARDSKGTGDKVKALVDSLNGALDLLAKNSSYDTVAKKGRPLSGDSRVRDLARNLSGMGSVFGSGTTATMSQLGISFTRDGRYTFDPAAFSKQLAADPDGVTALMGKAAGSIAGVVDDAIGHLGRRGWISTAVEGEKAIADNLQDRIDDWDVRLTDLEARYRSTYSALDSAINSLNSQKTYLASSLAGLMANTTR